MKQIIFSGSRNVEIQRVQKLKELFWTKKLGYYPTKIEKIVRKVTREKVNKEKEQQDLEFQEILKRAK